MVSELPGQDSSSSCGQAKNTRAGNFSPEDQRQLLANWKQRQLPVQFFGAARHTERADGIYAFVNGQRWTSSEDYQRWPLDPPLSDEGMKAAQQLGCNVRNFTMQQESPLHVVISSPYFRCIQTAALICEALGPGTELLVDRSLAEVYGPAVMGKEEPVDPVRGMDQTMAFCRAHGVTCQPWMIGVWPAWPERLQAAQRRYALRLLSILQTSTTAQRNFLLVGHGDTVGAVLSMMPSQLHQDVEKVEYGGMFLSRQRRPENYLSTDEQHDILSCVDSPAAEPGGKGQEECPASDFEVPSPRCLPKAPGKAGLLLHPPKTWDGWEVNLYDITMRKRQVAATLTKRVKALVAQGPYTQDKVEQLLGVRGNMPLGNDESEPPSKVSSDSGDPTAQYLKSLSSQLDTPVISLQVLRQQQYHCSTTSTGVLKMSCFSVSSRYASIGEVSRSRSQPHFIPHKRCCDGPAAIAFRSVRKATGMASQRSVVQCRLDEAGKAEHVLPGTAMEMRPLQDRPERGEPDRGEAECLCLPGPRAPAPAGGLWSGPGAPSPGSTAALPPSPACPAPPGVDSIVAAGAAACLLDPVGGPVLMQLAKGDRKPIVLRPYSASALWKRRRAAQLPCR